MKVLLMSDRRISSRSFNFLYLPFIVVAVAISGGCEFPRRQSSSWPQMNQRMPPAQEEVQIRLEKIPSGVKESPYAGIRVLTRNGSILLLVDTGTSTTLLRESIRPSLKLSKLSKTRIDGSNGDETQSLYSTSSLRVGPLEFTNETVAFLPDDQMDRLTRKSGRGVDGILGATLLSRGEIEFRGPEGELVIRPFDRSKIKADDRSMPLIFIPKTNAYAIPLRTETGQGSRLLLDTGTNVELILDEQRPLARRVMTTRPVGTRNYDSISGSHQVRLFTLPFSINGPGVTFPAGGIVCVDSQGNEPLDGIIGIPLFWRTPRILLNRQAELVTFTDISG